MLRDDTTALQTHKFVERLNLILRVLTIVTTAVAGDAFLGD